ncbi:MAG TPA: anti-sigma factor [Burkholderiaceae bacterium]
MDYSRPELADRLAAEYVAGLMRGPARRRFEALLPAHANLRAAVRAWQDRLMPLTAPVLPQQPSPAVWQRIEQRIGGASAAAAAATSESSAAWRRLAFWRGFAGVASVAAVVLAVALAAPGPAQPPLVIVLGPATPLPDTGGGAIAPASFVASVSPDGRAMVTKPIANVRLEPNRALELWALPKPRPGQKAEGPRSLGLVKPDGATVVQRGRVLDDVDALALSLEPSGGSPTGAPTGPVLYVGKLPPAAER